MKPIPESIDICGKIYKIKYVKNLKDEEGSELDGCVDKKKPIIYLCKDLKGGDLKSTFIHECFHAVVRQCNLSELVTFKDEECIVANLEQFIENKFVIYLK